MTKLTGKYYNKGLNIYVTIANSGPTQTLDFDGENLTLSDGGGSVKLVERKVFTPEAGFSGSIEQTEILGLPYGEKSGAIYMELESVVQALNAFYYNPDPYSHPQPPTPEPMVFKLLDTSIEGLGLTIEPFQSVEEYESYLTTLMEMGTSPDVNMDIQWRISQAQSIWEYNIQRAPMDEAVSSLNYRCRIYVEDGTWIEASFLSYGNFLDHRIKIVPIKDAVAPEPPIPTPAGPPIPTPV